MADKFGNISYEQLGNGHFCAIDPNVVRISFDKDSFYFEFGTKSKSDEKNNNVEMSSSVRVTIPQKSVLGLSDVLTQAYSEYLQKHSITGSDDLGEKA